MSESAAAVSVVVVTRDRPGFAATTVRSVLAGDLQPVDVLVVDESAVPDAEVSELADAYPNVRRLRPAVPGLSRARNLGASEARGEFVAFVDDDELASPGWLRALVAALGSNDDGTVVTGRVLPGDPEVSDALVPSTVLDTEAARFRGRLGRDVLAGGNMAIRRALFLGLGGFDPRLGPGSRWPAAEDNDLGLRILDAGHAIAYVPEAVVYHRAWRAGGSYPRIRWAYGLGKGGFYAKHLRLHGGYGLRRAVRDVGKRIARVPLTVWRRPRYALGELAYAAGVVLGMARWAVSRESA